MSTQYWEEEIEIMSREKLQELQLQRLKKTINIAANSPYYKEVFSKNGITGDSIQSLDDIRKIPFTTKSDMRANYPFGLVAGDMKRDGVRIHSSSGTTGNPTVIVHSQHDLDSWANLVARCLYMVGIRKTDVFQNSSGYGMFTGGLGFQYGAERLGCLTVPAAAGNSKRQIKFINDFKTTALHAIPSYAIRLAEVFQEEGLDPKGTTLKTLVIGAEPHTDENRKDAGRKSIQQLRYDRNERSRCCFRMSGTKRNALLGRLLSGRNYRSGNRRTRSGRRNRRISTYDSRPGDDAVNPLSHP